MKNSSPNSGFTLVEVMIALLLLSGGFIILLQALNTGNVMRTKSELLTQQSVLMNDKIQEIRSRRFDENTSSPWSSTLGTDSNTDAYLSFDGNDYVNLGGATSLSISDGITITSWVYHNSGSGHIVNQGGGWNSHGYSLFWLGNSIRIELQKSGQKTVSDNTAPSSGSWHHIAFTWETNSDLIKTYINGVQGSTTGTFSGPIGTPNENLNFGRKQNNGNYFNGSINNVTIWNIALSATEIQNYMTTNPIGTETGLVGYWKFNEGSGSTLTDLGGNNNGTINGATWGSQSLSESTISGWDDIDDFNLYSVSEIPNYTAFGCFVKVRYVQSSSGFHSAITGPSDYKRVMVEINHKTLPALRDTFIVSPGL
jgi:prepilin-type N-terminal cleavage/methylation domain-containing protein